jgi:hypothetical protein
MEAKNGIKTKFDFFVGGTLTNDYLSPKSDKQTKENSSVQFAWGFLFSNQ